MRDSGLLLTVFEDSVEREYWKRIWQRTHEKKVPITWWDYQWNFTCLSNGGLTALPNRNLVKNVGFGEDATHTSGVSIKTTTRDGIDPHNHPSFILRDALADRYTFDHVFSGKFLRFPWSLVQLLRKVAGLLAHTFKGALALFR